MLANSLEAEWKARSEPYAIEPLMRFSSDGLVLGAGTVLAPTASDGRHISTENLEPRLAALLTAAHLRKPSPLGMAHIRKAIRRWNDGEETLAVLHITLSGLGCLERPAADAYRLFLADRLLQEGLTACELVKSLGMGAPDLDRLRKYRPDQPRVPAGSGRPSGEWTTDPTTGGSSAQQSPQGAHPARGSVPPHNSPPAAPPSRPFASSTQSVPGAVSQRGIPPAARQLDSTSIASAAAPAIDLGALSGPGVDGLALFLSRLGAGAAIGAGSLAGAGILGLGFALIPSNGPTGKWVNLGGPGNISYYASRDVPGITLRYTTADGVQRELEPKLGPGGSYEDPSGKTVARWARLAGMVTLVVSTAALLGQDRDEARLCPAPSPDEHGENGVAYEDFMKSIFNPGNPTPSRMGYIFVDPKTGRPVNIDDCQQLTGVLAEFKGTGFDKHLVKNDIVWEQQFADMIDQAARQYRARGDRPLVWFFAERQVYAKMREVFRTRYPQIRAIYAPMPRRSR